MVMKERNLTKKKDERNAAARYGFVFKYFHSPRFNFIGFVIFGKFVPEKETRRRISSGNV